MTSLKKSPIFKYVITGIFSFLILLELFEFTNANQLMYQEHYVRFYKNPVSIEQYGFDDMSGKHYIFKDFKNNFTIIAFWAPWCKFCFKEFPHLDKLSSKLNENGFNIIPIVKEKEKHSNINLFYTKLKLKNIPPFTVKDPLLHIKLGVDSYPAFVVVNKSGEAIANLRPDWEADNILQMFDMIAGS